MFRRVWSLLTERELSGSRYLSYQGMTESASHLPEETIWDNNLIESELNFTDDFPMWKN